MAEKILSSQILGQRYVVKPFRGNGCHCDNEDHRFFACDVIGSPFFATEMEKIILRSVLRRCTNLKALCWQGRCPAEIGSLLNEFCPHLEHITILKVFDTEARGIQTVFEFLPINLRCFILRQELQEEAESLLCKFMATCEHLQTFKHTKLTTLSWN